MEPAETPGVTTRSADRSIPRVQYAESRGRRLNTGGVPRVAPTPIRRTTNYASQNRNPESERRGAFRFYRDRIRTLRARRTEPDARRPIVRPTAYAMARDHSDYGDTIRGLATVVHSLIHEPVAVSVVRRTETTTGGDSNTQRNTPPASSPPTTIRATSPEVIRSFLERIPFLARDTLSMDSAALLQNIFSFNDMNSGLTKKQIDESTVTYRFKPMKKTRSARHRKKASTSTAAATEMEIETTTDSTAEPEAEKSTAGTLSELDSSETCIICFDKFLSNVKLRRLPCLHVFHYKCIDNWLKSNIKCPICRVSIPIDYEKLMSSLQSGQTIDQCLREHEENMRMSSSPVATIRFEILDADRARLRALREATRNQLANNNGDGAGPSNRPSVIVSPGASRVYRVTTSTSTSTSEP